MRTTLALLATLLAIGCVAKGSSEEIDGGRALLTESADELVLLRGLKAGLTTTTTQTNGGGNTPQGTANGVPTVTTTTNPAGHLPPGQNSGGRKLLEVLLRGLKAGLTTTTTQTNGGGNTPQGTANGVPTVTTTTNPAGHLPPGQNTGGRKLLEESTIGRALLKITPVQVNGGGNTPQGNANGVPTYNENPAGNFPAGQNGGGRKLFEAIGRALLKITPVQVNGGGNTPQGNANGVPTYNCNSGGNCPPGQNGGRKLHEESSVGRALLKITQTNGGGQTPQGTANGVPYTNPADNEPGGFNKKP